MIRQTEFFLYTKNDREALDKCRALGHKYPECTGWIRAVKGDFRLVKEVGLKETGMLTSCSDYHIFHKLKFRSHKECMDSYCEVVQAAFDAGVRPRCHLEDVTRADIDRFVLPFVDRLMEMSEQVPEELSVKIRLCDTMGFGVSYPGAELPRSIPKLIYKMTHDCGVPSNRLEWHGHNDFHKVHINGATAWLYGCDALNTTLFGFGERTGNPPLEGAIFEYIALKGGLNGINTLAITELADYMRSIGLPISDNYPFAGKAFNVTRAGIHAGGLRQDERIYNIFDTEKAARHAAPRRHHRQERRRRRGPLGQRVLRPQGRRADQQDQGPQARPLGHRPVRGRRPADHHQRPGARRQGERVLPRLLGQVQGREVMDEGCPGSKSGGDRIGNC